MTVTGNATAAAVTGSMTKSSFKIGEWSRPKGGATPQNGTKVEVIACNSLFASNCGDGTRLNAVLGTGTEAEQAEQSERMKLVKPLAIKKAGCFVKTACSNCRQEKSGCLKSNFLHFRQPHLHRMSVQAFRIKPSSIPRESSSFTRESSSFTREPSGSSNQAIPEACKLRG